MAQLKLLKVRPKSGRAFVLPLDQPDKSSGGVYLPQAVKDQMPALKGHVVAVASTGRMMDSGEYAPVDVNLGDCVLFGPYTGTKATLDGVEYIVIPSEDIYAVIPEGVMEVS